MAFVENLAPFFDLSGFAVSATLDGQAVRVILDNGYGVGFDAEHAQDETHVGLRIMAERAQRIGASLEVLSRSGHGSSIILSLSQSISGARPPSEVTDTTTVP